MPIAPELGGPPGGELDVRARDVTLDARTRELVLEGDVRVEFAPFFLRADRLRLKRDARGAIDVEGPGRVAFCPCLGAPLAVRFDRATVAPPGDVIVKGATLEAAGVPVFYAPWFWLRAADEPGLLAPDVAWRGADGFFAGGGAHLPWARGDFEHGLDVRAGAYANGGTAIGGSLATPSSTTRVAWDHLNGDGLTADARGALEGAPGTTGLAWDADVIRGARGVRATTDVDAAARPFDRARAESSLRSEGWTVATSLGATAPRGGDWGDVGAAGPTIALRRADAIAHAGSYDATIDAGALTEPGRAASFARGEGGALMADRWGALGASLDARAAGDVADVADRAPYVDATGSGRSAADGAASARARLALPLQRSFDASDANDPWVHRLEPAIEASALASRGDDLLGVAPGRGLGDVRGDAWLGEASLASTFGRWGARLGSEASVAAGALGSFDDSRAPSAVLHARAAASSPLFALGGELARAWAPVAGGGSGGVLTGSLRVGARDAVNLVLLASERDGVDPVAARLLVGAPLAPSSGWLAADGWTAGARARVPFTAWLAATGGGDVDLTANALVDALGSIELHDRCGCLRLRATVAHRIGRDGVDAWLAIDIHP